MMNTTMRYGVTAAALIVVATSANGSPLCDSSSFSLCLNGVSTSVTNGASLRTSGMTSADIVRSRLERKAADDAQAGISGPQRGMSAGDLLGGFGAWVNYRGSWYDSDFVFNGSSLAYEADTDRGTFGLDRMFADQFLVGLSIGYESTDTDTLYNGGGQEADGFTVAPYGAWLINNNFSVDVSGGFTPLDYDQNRVSPADGTITTSSFDADRWFVAANLNGLAEIGGWVLGGRVGVLYTQEDQDGYVESGTSARTVQDRDINLTQVVVGGDVAYSFEEGFEPYALLIYRNDVSRDNDEAAGGLPGAFTSVQPDDDDEIEAGFGLRLFSSFGVTTSFEWSIIEGRDSFDGQNVALTIRGEL